MHMSPQGRRPVAVNADELLHVFSKRNGEDDSLGSNPKEFRKRMHVIRNVLQ
jgi:hypothetical protein